MKVVYPRAVKCMCDRYRSTNVQTSAHVKFSMTSKNSNKFILEINMFNRGFPYISEEGDHDI